MTQRKNTKRALLASVLSIVLCAAMLVGLTFAWFTDGVSTASNKIVAGNLDVALYNVDGSTETTSREKRRRRLPKPRIFSIQVLFGNPDMSRS